MHSKHGKLVRSIVRMIHTIVCIYGSDTYIFDVPGMVGHTKLNVSYKILRRYPNGVSTRIANGVSCAISKISFRYTLGTRL